MTDPVDLKTQVNQLIRGYWTTQAIYVVAELRIPDLLAYGAKTPEALAREAGANPDLLYRVLRALSSIGIFTEDEQGRFALTPLAETLRSEPHGGLHAYALLHGRELYQSWGKLLDAVRTGKPAFETTFGSTAFEYLAAHPERGAVFDKAMTGHHGSETVPMLEAYDFSGFRELVDVGGGNGSVLIVTLDRLRELRGVLFDLPPVVQRAADAIAAAGLKDRCRIESGDFLKAVPAGADAYLLRHVIHDWRDEDCMTILGHCRDAMRPGGRVLVVETVVPSGNGPSFAKWLDLMMISYGGKERTEKQYRDIFARAGLSLTRIVPTSAGVSVIEATKPST